MYLAAHFFMIFAALFVFAIILIGILALGVILLTIGLISRHLNKKKGLKKKYPKVCIIIGGIFMAISLGTFGMFAIDFLDDSGSEYNPDTYDPHEYNPQYEAVENERIVMEIIRCLEEKDAKSLKTLFSVEVSNAVDIDKQIQEAMEFYDGKTIKNGEFNHCSLWQSDSESGRYVYKCTHSEMFDIITESGKVYSLDIINVVVDDKNPDKLGLRSICFKNPDNLNEVLLFIGLPH